MYFGEIHHFPLIPVKDSVLKTVPIALQIYIYICMQMYAMYIVSNLNIDKVPLIVYTI